MFKSKKRTYLLFSLLPLIMCFCLMENRLVEKKRNIDTNGYNVIRITINLPIVYPDGKLINVTDSLILIYFGDNVIYKIPKISYEYDPSIEKPSNEFLSSKFVIKDIYYNYFVLKKHSNVGIYYDSLGAIIESHISADSFFNSMGLPGCSLYESIYSSSNDSLSQSIKLDGSCVVDKYITKVKFNENYNDTTYLYYDQSFSKVPFSFCNTLDSVKKIKLYRSRFIYNESYSVQFNRMLPKRELWFEMEKLNNYPDLEKINKLISIN